MLRRKIMLKLGSLVVASCVLILLASSCDGLEHRTLTPADSASIYIVALESLQQEAGVRVDQANRLWFPGVAVVGDNRIRYRSLSPDLWSQFTKRWPQAKRLHQDPFECPPGKSVIMPGYGCPIRQHGMIVRLDPLQIQRSGAVAASVHVIHSGEADNEWWTQQVGVDFTLERSESGDWVAADSVISISVT